MPNNNPNFVPLPPPINNAGSANDSVLIGFIIGWALMICGSVAAGFLASVFPYNSSLYSVGIIAVFTVPVLFVIGGMVWFYNKGKIKTVKGIGAALLSLVALAVLLVAACFGIVALGGRFH